MRMPTDYCILLEEDKGKHEYLYFDQAFTQELTGDGRVLEPLDWQKELNAAAEKGYRVAPEWVTKTGPVKGFRNPRT